MQPQQPSPQPEKALYEVVQPRSPSTCRFVVVPLSTSSLAHLRLPSAPYFHTLPAPPHNVHHRLHDRPPRPRPGAARAAQARPHVGPGPPPPCGHFVSSVETPRQPHALSGRWAPRRRRSDDALVRRPPGCVGARRERDPCRWRLIAHRLEHRQAAGRLGSRDCSGRVPRGRRLLQDRRDTRQHCLCGCACGLAALPESRPEGRLRQPPRVLRRRDERKPHGAHGMFGPAEPLLGELQTSHHRRRHWGLGVSAKAVHYVHRSDEWGAAPHVIDGLEPGLPPRR